MVVPERTQVCQLFLATATCTKRIRGNRNEQREESVKWSKVLRCDWWVWRL